MLPLVGRYNCSPYPEIQLCWAWRGWDVSNFLLATRPDRCTYRPVGIPTLMVIFLHAACVVPAVERCWSFAVSAVQRQSRAGSRDQITTGPSSPILRLDESSPSRVESSQPHVEEDLDYLHVARDPPSRLDTITLP